MQHGGTVGRWWVWCLPLCALVVMPLVLDGKWGAVLTVAIVCTLGVLLTPDNSGSPREKRPTK